MYSNQDDTEQQPPHRFLTIRMALIGVAFSFALFEALFGGSFRPLGNNLWGFLLLLSIMNNIDYIGRE